MFRHISRLGMDLRLACVSVMLLVSVVCGENAKDVGANLKFDSRLSALEEREYQSWSSYIKALLCKEDSSFGLRLYNRYLSEALGLAPDSRYLINQWRYGRDLKEHPEKHFADLKEIWEKTPESANLTMLYMDLLMQADKRKEALEVVLRCQELNNWNSGVLTLRYVELTHIEGRSDIVEEMLRRALLSCKDEELTRANVAAACYWRACHEDENAILHDEAIGWYKRFKTKILSSRYRRKCLKYARRAAEKPEDLESMSSYVLSSILGDYELWDEQVAFLEGLEGDELVGNMASMVWFFIHSCHALKEAGRTDELREILGLVKFGTDWHRDVLICAAEMYMALEDYGRTVEIYEMLSQKEPREIRWRLMIAHISLVQGNSVKGLAALAPLRGLPPVGCVLKARLLEQHGDHEAAYREYISLLKIAGKEGMEGHWKPDHGFYNGIIMTCLSLNKRDEALKYVKEMYELDPEDPHGCNFYGYLLADFNQELDFAEHLINKALAQEPDNVAYIDSLAWVRYRQGRFAEALDEMAKVLKYNGLEQDPDGELREHLAAILKEFGISETADYYQKQADGLKKSTAGH